MSLQNFKIWTNDGLIEKEDAKEMRHVDPQAAVEEFVETYDKNNLMYFASGGTSGFSDTIIFVEDEESSVTKWNLTVETNPQYYAKEVK